MDFFLPMLRADFTMDETYYDKELTVLQSPIEAFGGRKDREADEKAMKEWRKYTERAFHCHMFEGGHFLHTGAGRSCPVRSKEMPF